MEFRIQLTCVGICFLIWIPVAEASYDTKVTEVFSSLKEKLSGDIETCIQEAEKKGNEKENEPMKQKAAAVVNLYTQKNCSIGKNTFFYKELNRNLREMTNNGLWNDYSAVLTEAMDLLGTKSVELVYRGQTDISPKPNVNQPYKFGQFTSTSLEKKEAEGFAKEDGVLFTICGATGLDVARYSSFPGEKELLLKPAASFKVLHIDDQFNLTQITLRMTETGRRKRSLPALFVSERRKRSHRRRRSDDEADEKCMKKASEATRIGSTNSKLVALMSVLLFFARDAFF